jgi:3,4-dihydroxy 2-butanone 4-phosphate synthase/GTP cyclohydrolase II
MKLAEWLTANGMRRGDFARRIGVTPGAVTQICNQKGAWVSRDTAEAIVRETGGAVTPNDLLSDAGLRGLTGGDDAMAIQQSVNEAVEAIRRGELVIVTDDDDRENEGDLICAASLCTTEQMAFIIRNCCGIVCTPMTADDARRLQLSPMVAANDAPLGTAFTVSVDVRHGLTTGISAEQRNNTVRALANGNMGAGDFVRPGHVFPLIARDGGVLMRSGHTEAAVDLCRLAGLPPVGVICELANDDGTVMVGAQIDDFARKHGIKKISVADLIAYRQSREKLVERVSTFPVKSVIGEITGYAYQTRFDQVQHFAFVHGRIGDGLRIPTRLHRVDIINDVLGGATIINKALERFKAEGQGVLIYLRDGTAGVPVHGGAEESADQMRTVQWREVGLGAQIMRDLGIRSIKLLASKDRTYVGLSGFGIEIVSRENVEG